MNLYARSSGGPVETWQPLEAHLNAVAARAASFADVFNSGEWAWNLGWLHDLGKATTAFQRYMRTSNGLDDAGYDADDSLSNHASTGAALAHDEMGLPGRALAYALAGHHAGLPDYRATDTGNAALTVRLKEGRRNLATLADFASIIRPRLRPLSRPPPFVRAENFHLWARLLFSCLVDADRLDSEEFSDRAKHGVRGTFPRLEELAVKFFHALDALEASASPSDVNRVRAEIRCVCEAAAAGPSGLYALAVPTGGGKTLSAMAFALRHALRHRKRRVIYVIPYTSIVEQTAKILGDIFGPDNVVEHHSNMDPADAQRRTLQSELAAENWDAPIIVTTNVHFFESLYSARPGRARKLHNIVQSVVILDEAQLIPPELLTPCVDIVNALTEEAFGVTLVLATATQPALPGLKTPTEIVPHEMNLYGRLRRTNIELPTDLHATTDWESLRDQLCAYDQALCIVNTRRDCHDLFKEMPRGTIHLSALMCGAHRSKIIGEIKRQIAKGEPCRVISTQLVEAGVDLDFPVVYRALAGLDSIVQAAGRCNREGRLNPEGRLGRVQVFVPPGRSLPALLRKGADKMRELACLPEFDPQDPVVFVRYFELFYSAVNDTGQRFRDDLVRGVSPDLEIDFRTAGARFKMIDDAAQQSVLVRWVGADPWIAQVRAIGPTRENLRALQRNCVNLAKGHFNAAVAQRQVEELWPGYWLWIGKYDAITGLDVFGDGYLPEELTV